MNGPSRTALGAVLLVWLCAAAPQSGSEVEAWARAEVETYRARFHLSAGSIDADAIAVRVRGRFEETGSAAGLGEWLAAEVTRAEWAFAPADARPGPARGMPACTSSR